MTALLTPRRVRPGVSDGYIVSCAAVTAAGAYLVEWPGAAVAAVIVGVIAVKSLRVAGLVFVFLLAGWLAGRSLEGLEPPASTDVSGVVTLVGDPEWVGGAIRVDVRLAGRRYEAWARGGPAHEIGGMLAGESVELRGSVEPFEDEWTPRRARHVIGQIDVRVAWNAASAPGLAGVANALRRSLVQGASSLSHRDQVLLAGFSVGDDRQQLPEVTDDFRAAGLTHLTAVSGQNVAFVLMLVGPLLRRLSPRGRLLLTSLVLLQFGLITRWEPSVMRAIALAVGASFGQLFEGVASGIRMLGLIVTILLLIDPMLVHSVGFRLSVLASVGIALFSERFTRRIGGRRWISEPLGLTLAAQIGVSPVLIATFGSMPLISVPANMAAGPAAGPLMAWGLVVGPLAGRLPLGLASILHVPTRVLTGYVAGVARVASATNGPELGMAGLGFVICLGAMVWLARKSLRWWLLVVGIAVLWGLSPSRDFDVGQARLVQSDGQVAMIIDRPAADRLLSGARLAGVGYIDLLVMKSASERSRSALASLEARHAIGLVVAGARIEGASTISEITAVRLGSVSIVLTPRGGRLDVELVQSDTSR